MLAFRAAATRRRQEHDLAVFTAWRTATLMRTQKRIPALSRLLRSRTKKSRAEQAAIRAEVAEAEAEFARLDAEAAARQEVSG